ncbi:MAG: hypothetical protein BWK76_14875 [Desulfobulbaceae bacterium A2]|nr:MAG: hypothetical protein BWK76_14875 [Desulfobulbaceae bacterium A2]
MSPALSATTVEIARRWQGVPGMVTGALQDLQEAYGYLPEEGLTILARELGVPLSQLFSVATFFTYFRLAPRGTHHIQLCQGTACHVLGAAQLRGKLVRDLEIADGDLSRDRQFSLETVRCLGCCGIAPVLRIDDQTHGRVRQRDLARLLQPQPPPESDGADQDN